MFRNHNILQLCYEEDLLSNYSCTFQKTIEFLDVEKAQLPVVTSKSKYPDHLSLIKNKDEFINHFKIDWAYESIRK